MLLVLFVHHDLNAFGSLSESPHCRRFGKGGVLVAALILRITQLKQFRVLFKDITIFTQQFHKPVPQTSQFENNWSTVSSQTTGRAMIQLSLTTT